MFRNLRLYRLQSDWPDSEAALSEALAEAAFKPCGPFTERSAGWEAPAAGLGDLLCRRVGGADLLSLRSQSRLLPAAAVNEVLEERVQAFEARALRPPGRKEKRQLREEVHGELLPKALLRSRRLRGFHLAAERLIGIDTTSAVQAELFLDQLRAALGTLQVKPLAFKLPVSGLLASLFLGQGPAELRLGRECRMQDPAAGSASVHWVDMDLADANVRKLVKDGLRLQRLAVELDGIMTCVLDQDGGIRKIRLHDGDAADIPDEDPLARLDAGFVMLTGTARRLIGILKKALNGYG